MESLLIIFVEWRSGHIKEALAIAVEIANTITSQDVLFGYHSLLYFFSFVGANCYLIGIGL